MLGVAMEISIKKKTMEDRLSNLPDELLLHILSFLPTEDVFATSLACKRKKPLWLSVPNLDFDEKRCTRPGYRSLLQSPSSFIRFIHSAIHRRGIHQPIKTLRLKGKYQTFTNHVQTWLNVETVRRDVESIEIDCYTGLHCWTLPCSILSNTTKTLAVLKLHSTKFGDFSSVELPSLKALHLNIVHFFKAQHLMLLLNGCPNLENLEAHYIRFDFKDPSLKGTGKLQTLSKLVRADLSFKMMNMLGTFYIHDFLRQLRDDADPVFPNLIHFELILGGIIKMEWVLYLLNHCPRLQTFVFENAANKVWPNTPVVPECFSSQLQTCIITKFVGIECEMTFAKFVMQNSRSLRTMKIFTYPDVDLSQKEKADTRIELESCPRSSATCELLLFM